MRSVRLLAPAVLTLAVVPAVMQGRVMAAPAPTVDLVVHAQELHVGDGQVLLHAAVAILDGRIVEVSPTKSLRSVGRAERHVATLMPGLVTSFVPEEATDVESANVDRRAVGSATDIDEGLARRWIPWGITSLAVTPGRQRFVSGRAGFVRLMPGAPHVAVERGAVCASLAADAQDPPLVFDTPLRVSVDAPIAPARPQRPSTSMAAVGELRRLISHSPEFEDVRSRRSPLRLHADREEDVRRAIGLASELGIDVVVEGGAEAWKLADELAAARILVVLELPDPSAPAILGRDLEFAPDAAGVLARAGVDLALAARTRARRPDPLLLAATAMRQGASPAQAIAGITGHAARAVGAAGFALLRAGAPADLAGFDSPALALRAVPTFVLIGGEFVDAERSGGRRRALADEDMTAMPPLALRAGHVLTGKGVLRDGIVLTAGRRIVSVGTSAALPEGAILHDFGADAVLAPGFVDAFGWLGLEPGAAPAGSSRLRAADAIDAAHPSLRRALRSGVTSALVVPGARGLLLGSAAHVATAPSKDGTADILSEDAAFVFWMDDGPTDTGPRSARLKALKEFLQKAKTYHEDRAKIEKGEKGDSDSEGPKDEPDPDLEPLRQLFDGSVKAKTILRSGRQDVMLEALDAFKGVGLTPILAGAEEADGIATELAQRGVSVILSPLTTRQVDGKIVSVAATLRAAGVTLALGSFGYGGSDQLPLAACAAVRDGLSAEDALAAITTSAASLGGPADVGRLEAGARADVVAWSGDPMEPTSRILGVVSGGLWIEGVGIDGGGP